MLNAVDVVSSQGSLLTLPLTDVSDGIVLQEIGGLDPVKATIVTSSFASVDGQQYHSARREARNITMSLGIEPVYGINTVSKIRQRLYEYFMPKQPVDLTFHTDEGMSVTISGRVETFESPLFTKEPTVDISVMCFDPDFIDSTPMVLSANTTSGAVDTAVPYNGTVESGFFFELLVNRTISAFTIYQTAPDGTLSQLDFASNLISGDVVDISTVPGNKSATLLRAGVTSSLLYAVSPQSKWLDFQPGDNLVRVYATGSPIPYTITYYNRYGGL